MLRIGLLFFFSGFPALLYQLVWQRALFRIFGVNIEAVTIVVTAFMVGLGLGSLLGGLLSKRIGQKLLLFFAIIEAATALFGIASLAIFEAVGGQLIGASLLVTGSATLLLVLVPTLLMGATLPLMSEHITRRTKNTGYSVGYLYYVNTLGAAIACFAGMGIIFPFSGMQSAVYIAVLVNIAVAIAALRMHFLDAATVDEEGAQNDSDSTSNMATSTASPGLSTPVMLALGGLAGFIALSYEIYLFRIASFISGNMAPTFAIVLGAFLLGVASGSREISEISRKSGSGARKAIMNSLVLATLIGAILVPGLAQFAALHNSLLLGGMIAAVFLIARSWGMLLPYLAHLGIRATAGAGKAVSHLYMANIVGSALGSISTGFILMHALPLVSVGKVLALFGLAAIAVFYLSFYSRTNAASAEASPAAQPASGVRLSVSYAVIPGFALIAVALAMPVNTNAVFGKLMFREKHAELPAVVKSLESRSGIITLDAAGEVRGHGAYDGKFNTNLFPDTNVARRPYAVSLLHKSPRRMLMIGLSTGSWAKILANNPAVEKLTIIEINSDYLRLIADQPEVRSILKNPKVKIIVDDGRRWLRANPDKKFDFIVQNTTWHYRANITNLLSTEYMKIVANHLEKGGVYFFNTTFSDRVQRTACTAFSHGLRFHNHMAVSREQLDVNFRRWEKSLLAYKIDGLHVVDRNRPVHAAGFKKLMNIEKEWNSTLGGPDIERCSAIKVRTKGSTLVTDDNMGTEWRYSFGLK